MDYQSLSGFHLPTQEYTFRVPSPPRIFVPPPYLNQNGIPDLKLCPDGRIDYESSGFSNAEFLNTVTYGNLITANNMVEWEYERRRTAQKIVPFLYLGPMSVAKNKEFLVNEGITMVLAVRNTQSAHMKFLTSRAAHELGLEVTSIDVDNNQELIAAFPRGIEAINTHLSKMYRLKQALTTHDGPTSNGTSTSMPGKVLVFCETGNERSATMVAAYIMAMYSKDLYAAIQLVQAQRFCVAFDDSLRNLLQTYETILQAKKDVYHSKKGEFGVGKSRGKAAESPIGHTIRGGKPTKRSFDDAENGNEDVDMDGSQGQTDKERFANRAGLAPFTS